MIRLKKAVIITVFIAGAAFVAAGCTEPEIVTPQSVGAEPDFQTKENIEIDWEQVQEDCQAALSKEDYPKGDYIDIDVERLDQNVIRLIWVLSNDATQVEALNYGPDYIKAFNDAAAVQDFSIKKSADGYYGGLWDKYTLELEIFTEGDIMKPENYYVNQIIDPGKNDPVIPVIRGNKETESSGESSSGAGKSK